MATPSALDTLIDLVIPRGGKELIERLADCGLEAVVARRYRLPIPVDHQRDGQLVLLSEGVFHAATHHPV